jgi:hypothetical protein
MASRKCKLSEDFGVFSRIHPDRISIIKFGAKQLAAAFKDGNETSWREIIQEANRTFGKNERGLFSAFAIMMVEAAGE